MSLRRWRQRARRASGWLLAVLLLATLAPAVSRVLGAGTAVEARPGEHWVELCTSIGVQWVRTDLTADIGDSAPDPDALDRCGHCTLASERFAALAPSLPTLPQVLGEPVAPPVLVVLFRVFSAPLPGARGPPLLG